MSEDKDHDKLFADLDALTEQQIEVGLAGPSCCAGLSLRPPATET